MRSMILAVLFALIAGPQQPPTVITSACTCQNCHGSYRAAVKSDTDAPPLTIPASHRLTPSDIAAWSGPGGTFHANSPRVGKELEWFQVTGRVADVRIEADGDLHLQLVDTGPPAQRPVQLIVEIPLGRAWCATRQQVFGWTTSHFPLRIATGASLSLSQDLVVRVTGRAFYDAEHDPGANTTKNRRADGGMSATAIWEIHPVAGLERVP